MPSTLRSVTAEPGATQQAVRDPTQVIVRRIVANMVDALVVVFAMFAVLFITGDVEEVANCNAIPAGRACFDYQNQAVMVNRSALVWFVLSAIVMIVLVVGVPQALAGTSAGKALLGIRVVRRDGSPPGGWRSLVRLMAWTIDGLALLLPVALWSVLLTPGHRRVGALLAGTYLVRRNAADSPVEVGRPKWLPGRKHVG